MADIKFENISFNADYWQAKDEKFFTEACKAEGKFKGDNQDKLIREAWKAIKGTGKKSAVTEKPGKE